jgi:hypothetical protein
MNECRRIGMVPMHVGNVVMRVHESRLTETGDEFLIFEQQREEVDGLLRTTNDRLPRLRTCHQQRMRPFSLQRQGCSATGTSTCCSWRDTAGRSGACPRHLNARALGDSVNTSPKFHFVHTHAEKARRCQQEPRASCLVCLSGMCA